MRDPATGEVRGPSFELARELARRAGKPLDFKAVASPPAVISAVAAGEADIGFVAYEATRLGSVDFSQTYMLVRQSFMVPSGSPITSVADIDKSGLKIAGTPNDSITLCLKRVLKYASAVEVANDPQAIAAALADKSIDAIGANRQRLTTLSRGIPGSALLADNLFNVPQNIVVAKERPGALAEVEAVIDEARASGLLAKAIAAGGAVGVEIAPKSSGSAHGCPG